VLAGVAAPSGQGGPGGVPRRFTVRLERGVRLKTLLKLAWPLDAPPANYWTN
jgi:hypothetical protein